MAKILLVVKYSSLRDLWTRILTDAGHDVTAVASIEEGKSFLPVFAPDVTIIDDNGTAGQGRIWAQKLAPIIRTIFIPADRHGLGVQNILRDYVATKLADAVAKQFNVPDATPSAPP